MTDTNRYGPGVSWRDLRKWAIAGIGLWFPAYLRDAERHHNVTTGYCGLPSGFRLDPQENAAIATAEGVKHPEQRLPIILIVSPGMGDTPPRRQANRTFNTEWGLSLWGIVHGKTEDEAELCASIYGMALSTMAIQQAGAWADLDAYTGPPVTVDTVDWASPGLDFQQLDISRRRSVVAAVANFTVVFRDSATSQGPSSPPVDPIPDPGDWPEVIQTELDIDREAPRG